MATVEPQLSSVPIADVAIDGPRGWKRRLEDPFNTHYRYPIALAMVRLLVRTPVTPNQISMVQPVFAAGAGYCLTFDDWRYHVAAVVLFELRSILDCVDGSLARAKRMSSPNGHAIDAVADWLGVVFLYIGIFQYVLNHPVQGVPRWLGVLVVSLAMVQAGMRSMAADYFKQKYLAIYERSADEVPELLRDKVLGLGKSSSLFDHVEVFIMRMGHLFFEFEWFDPRRSRSLPAAAVDRMVREQGSRRVRALGVLWSVSSGDAFLSFVILSILFDALWVGQVFFATAGWAWIVLVIAANVMFLRRYRSAEPG